MSDLPNRLRSSDGWKVFTAGDGERAFTVDTDLMDEAADYIEQLQAELRLVAGWFMKGDDGGLLIDHGGGWISGVEFPNLSTYIDEVQP